MADRLNNVQDAVHLSTSQKEAVLAARHELLTRMSSIVAERQPIVACLQAWGPSPKLASTLLSFILSRECYIMQ